MIREADLESGKISGDVKSLSFLEKDIPKRIVEKRSKLRNAWKTQTRLERYLYFFTETLRGRTQQLPRPRGNAHTKLNRTNLKWHDLSFERNLAIEDYDRKTCHLLPRDPFPTPTIFKSSISSSAYCLCVSVIFLCVFADYPYFLASALCGDLYSLSLSRASGEHEY